MTMVTVVRVVRLGFTNYARNRGLSLSASLILSLTLFIITIFFFLSSILAAASAEIRNKIDLVATFDDDVAQEQIEQLQKVLAVRPETRQVTYISKEEAIERFQNIPGVSDRTKQLITPENNPLPRSLEIKAASPEQLESISAFLSSPPWSEVVRRNSYVTNKERIQKISQYERAATVAGITLSAIFVVISLIVVINTIRLAIFARREEIEIMRLVGANNLFIRAPFLIEGILYGLIATIVALLAAWLMIQPGNFLTVSLSDIGLNVHQLFADRLPLLILVELSIGLFVAIFATMVSIQRYLNR